MTESGGTARFLSRFRSSVPIYALSRHDGSRRRMALMRDVFPIDFDSRGLATREAARDAVQALHDAGLLAAGDHIMFTRGHRKHGVAGKRVSVSVDLGGSRIIKKTKQKRT